MQQILSSWDEYARTMKPASDEMSLTALRDHSEAMLRAIALDIDSPQTSAEQIEKSFGEEDEKTSSHAAAEHGELRHASNFTLIQLSSEFRALRASVLRLWLKQVEKVSPSVLDDVIRFNEAIDQALAQSIVTYLARGAHSRDLFDAILGHDLRGPISAIKLAGELLSMGQLPAAQTVALGARIKSSARYMSSMVDDMLEFARVRLGNMPIPIHRQHVDLEFISAGAVADAAAMHPGCSFEVDLSGRDQAWLDPDRIRQLLMNLLGNAGQHGARGRPVRLSVSADAIATTFKVINEGHPIPEEHLKTIFEPLVRLNADHADQAHRTTSLGLGLHIAREIATAHGGSLTAESQELTIFTVRIPVQDDSAADHT